MQWVRAWRGETIGLDTAPLIYFVEQNTEYVELVRLFFEAFDRGDLHVVTSTVTLAEVLAQPLRFGNNELARRYRTILLWAPGLDMVELSPVIAERTALLRSQYNLQTLDAIQLATALEQGASAFLTNDTRLPKLPNLNIVTLVSLKKESELFD
jgi:predicted nucleic acid-binding protein